MVTDGLNLSVSITLPAADILRIERYVFYLFSLESSRIFVVNTQQITILYVLAPYTLILHFCDGLKRLTVVLLFLRKYTVISTMEALNKQVKSDVF